MNHQQELLTLPMLRIIAHDLENHLTGIYGSVDLFNSGLLGGLTDKQKEYVDIVKIGAKKIELLVMNLVGVKKMEEGILKTEAEDFTAADLLHGLDWLAKEAALEKKALRLQDDDKLTIHSDQDLLSRVLENLIDNAIKHTGHDGQVTLKVSGDHDQTLFEVTDNGEGIPAENLELIFESFHSLPGQQTKTSPGLGLAYCRLAVRALGGEIRVESAVGRGSRFYFSLRRG